MKNKNTFSEYDMGHSNVHSSNGHFTERITKTFSKNYDAGISIFLEYRSTTNFKEYELPGNTEPVFAEYELVSDRLNTAPLATSASVDEYTVDLKDNNFYVEPFAENMHPPKVCCDECAVKEEYNTPAIAIKKDTPAAKTTPPATSPNKETNKILSAISDIASSNGTDEISNGFLEDIKTILTDPKTLKKEIAQQQSVQQSAPEPPTKEEDIFDRIAKNMQYANQYDFGTLELDKRFDEFDRMSDIKSVAQPNVHVRATNNSIETVALQKPAVVSSADFLEDLDIMSKPNRTALWANSKTAENVASPDQGVGGRSISSEALQIGDLIISSTSDDHILNAIGTVTGSEISHAAVYAGNGSVMLATDNGVTEWSLGELINNSSLSVAYHQKNMDATKAAKVITFLRNALVNNKGFDSWALLYAAPAQLLASYCDSLTGEAREACLHGAKSMRPGTDSNDQFFCSELIFAAFKDAGLSISTVQPSFSSPHESVKLFHDGTLQYVGHLK